MASITIPDGLSKLVLYENLNYDFSREQVTVKSGQNLAAGAVVAYDTGKIVVFQTGTTGDPCGILLFAVNATSADTQGVMIARHAIMRTASLVWDSGESSGEKTAALVKLAALGILVRTEV